MLHDTRTLGNDEWVGEVGVTGAPTLPATQPREVLGLTTRHQRPHGGFFTADGGVVWSVGVRRCW